MKTYKFVIWGLVGLLVAYWLLSKFEFDGRRLLFPIALIGGYFAMISLWFLGDLKDGVQKVHLDGHWFKKDTQDDELYSSVESLMLKDELLTKKGAREWLDSFLIRQQQ